jgi:hypothetical protein
VRGASSSSSPGAIAELARVAVVLTEGAAMAAPPSSRGHRVGSRDFYAKDYSGSGSGSALLQEMQMPPPTSSASQTLAASVDHPYGVGGSTSTSSAGRWRASVPEAKRISQRVLAGDYLVGLNGESVLGKSFLQVVTAILKAERPLTLRFWRPPRQHHHHYHHHHTAAAVALPMQPQARRVLQQSLLTEAEYRQIAQYVFVAALSLSHLFCLGCLTNHRCRSVCLPACLLS